MTELALETAPRWPPDCPAIQGPPRISSALTPRPPVPDGALGIHPASGLERDETGRHNDSAPGARLSFFTPQVIADVIQLLYDVHEATS